MASLKDDQKPLEDVARESLDTFATIADAARNHLASATKGSLSVPIADNTWTETGEIMLNGKDWTKFFEMNLKKVS